MYSIAILVPLTSKGRIWNNIEESYFFQYLFLSIIKNYKKGYKIKFYLGIDEDEELYTNENINIIFEKLKGEIKKNITYELIIYKDIERGYLTKMWNILGIKAYKKNYHDYYFQIGDDIFINDKNLIEDCINILKKNNDFGITGPSQTTGATEILTNAFFSNKHIEIFGKVFLEDIKNWHCDNWIDNIYLPNYNYRLRFSFIKNLGLKPRYDYISASKIINKYITRDKEIIGNYVKNKKILKKKPILIIGNGKSAGQIDWKWLNNNKDKIDTFGINSAYKMYDKLNFYPTYYANLDNVVIKSHKDKLQELLNKKKIKKCFYLSNVEFNENETYYKLHKIGGAWKGISKNNLEFKTWANTGSDCVQLALMMGYREIYIIGIDGYIEKINESTLTHKNTLIIKETPKDNPNYWFADYQEKGDEYNIPNALKWHKPGWDYSALVCNKLNIKYYNLSSIKDYVRSIPFMDYNNFKNIINDM